MTSVISGCSKNEPPGPEAGKAYFQALNCRTCHRVGTDGGTTGPDLTYVGFRHSKEWLELWLKNPQGWKPDTLMPNPHLSEHARQGVVEYLTTLKGEAFGGNPPWKDPALATPLERGRVLYAKAGCVACHGKGGTGGYPNNNFHGNAIPAVMSVSETYTKDELIKKIARGVLTPAKEDPKGPSPLIFMPPWGQKLSPEEISDVADYLLSLKNTKHEEMGF